MSKRKALLVAIYSWYLVGCLVIAVVVYFHPPLLVTFLATGGLGVVMWYHAEHLEDM